MRKKSANRLEKAAEQERDASKDKKSINQKQVKGIDKDKVIYDQVIGAREVFATAYDKANAKIDEMQIPESLKQQYKSEIYQLLVETNKASMEGKARIMLSLVPEEKKAEKTTYDKIKWAINELFGVKEAEAVVPIAAGTCAVNPACAALAAATVAAFIKASVDTYKFVQDKIGDDRLKEEFPIEEQKTKTLSTPVHESKVDKESFPADISFTKLPGFEKQDFTIKLPGFEVHAGADLKILYKDDGSGDYKSEYWPRYIEFKGNKVYQRDDLIDPNYVRPDGKGTNFEAMKQGYAPLGSDGKSINLHHLIQSGKGAIAEVTATFHQKNSKIIHINPSTIDSGINREEFKKWRESYWEDRAKDFNKEDVK